MENKCCEEGKVCCENRDGVKCEHGMKCCSNFKKCHMMKRLMVIILIIIAFCLGTQWGEMRALTRGAERFERGGMMNWGYGKFGNIKSGDEGQTSGSITVEVAKPVTPASKQ